MPSAADLVAAARLLQGTPPHAIEAEQAVLGAMLLDKNVVSDVHDILRTGEDFFEARHRSIYQAAIDVFDKSGSVDLVRLHQLLIDRGILEDVGGLAYLQEVAECVPSATYGAQYAREVREKAAVRELIEAAGAILCDAHASAEDSQALLEAAEQRIFSIAQRRETSSVTDLRSLLEEAIKHLEQRDGASLTGLASGYDDLDDMLSGLQRGELIILAARPSMGKTALALNLMEGVAATGKAVGMFSLEMGKQQLVQRLLCARAQVDSQRMRRGMLKSSDLQRLISAADSLQESRIFIDDTPALSLMSLRSKARRLKEQCGVSAIFIDYLQLMTSGSRTESRQVEVSDISRGIKAMARELDVPVVCLAQLNRMAEQRDGHRPRMSDLRESGSIEQDADVIMMLHREEYYHQADPEWAERNPTKVGVAELIIAKQRNGPTGVVTLSWNSRETRFESYSSRTPPEGVAFRPYEAPMAGDDIPV
jgi:replicative DNA helicase